MSEPAAPGADFGALLVPVPMRTAGERIAERLVTAIALGEFEPGQRLPTERDLAATLEVSRTTVREALQRLQAAGYVTTRRGRGGGTFIQTGAGPGSDEMIKRTLGPAWDELTELLDYRRLIEQQIARTAAERRSADDVEIDPRAVGEYAHACRPGRLPAGRPRAAPGDRPGHAQHPPGRPVRADPPGGRPRLRRRTVHAQDAPPGAAAASHPRRGGHRR
jgi:DNA-binding transcriptional regulator YhcF (GntR family)